jgi:hypothetical protein
MRTRSLAEKGEGACDKNLIAIPTVRQKLALDCTAARLLAILDRFELCNETADLCGSTSIIRRNSSSVSSASKRYAALHTQVDHL